MVNKKTLITIYLCVVPISIFLMMETDLYAAGNGMEIPSQQPQILPSFNTIGFNIRFSSDDNKNGQAMVRYRQSGGTWQQGHSCIRVWYSNQYEWAGRIFHLETGIRYEIEVTFADPDGVIGQNPVVFTANSRSEPVTVNSGGHTYHVSLSGDDSNDGSLYSPFKTIEKAISVVTAGVTVFVHEGTYRMGRNNPLVISKSGTAQSPIIIKAVEGDEVIIDSFDSGLSEPGTVTWQSESPGNPGIYSAPCNNRPYLVFYKGHYLCPSTSLNHLVNGKYNYDGKLWDIGTYGGWYYSNNRLHIKFPVTFRDWSGPAEDPSSTGVQIALSRNGVNISGDYVVFDGFIVQHTRNGISISGDYVVVKNTECRRNMSGIGSTGYFTLIDHCEVGCSPTYWYREWELGHDVIGTSGISFDARNGGNSVVRNSRIYGVENGLCCASPWSDNAFGDPSYNPGTIIMNNEFDLIGDDAIETDGPGYNVVIYGNHFHDCFVAISTAPIGVGPIWAIRNIIYAVDRPLPGGGADRLGKYGGAPYGAFKFNCGGRPPKNGPMLIYHNTSLVNTTLTLASPFSRIWDNTPGLDVVLRNNSFVIKQGQGQAIWIEGYASGYTFSLDIDYNNLYCPSGSDLAKIINKDYNDLSELQADGYELNGVSENSGYADPSRGDFSLPTGSLLVDTGIHIPGINDVYYGTAPDIGAVELPDPALSADLCLFRVSLKENSVELEWQITSEFSYFGFEIERSLDRRSFDKIGFVKEDSMNRKSQIYHFLDTTVQEGKNYYRLRQLNSDGTFEFSPIVEVIVMLPVQFCLKQNYPNPFNPLATINYYLPYTVDVELSIFDMLGRHIKTLIREKQSAGRKIVKWNGKDNNNANVSSGTYFYRLRAGEFSDSKSMILIR